MGWFAHQCASGVPTMKSRQAVIRDLSPYETAYFPSVTQNRISAAAAIERHRALLHEKRIKRFTTRKDGDGVRISRAI
jgi:hypothetical protein